jgi:hypothetical protein
VNTLLLLLYTHQVIIQNTKKPANQRASRY